MKRIIVLSLIVLLCQCTIAQTVAVRVTTGENLPYIAFVNGSATKYLSSDSDGNIDINSVTMPDSTLLTLNSYFFEPLRITFGELKRSKILTVTPKTIDLQGIVVMPQASIKELVKKCEYYFAANYAENYVAFAKIFRFVLSGNTYRQMYCSAGIWEFLHFTDRAPKLVWDDENGMGGFYAMDSYVSYSYDPNTNRIQSENIRSKHLKSGHVLKNLENSYANLFDISLLNRKRSIELYSPLNKSQLDNFNYSIKQIEEKNGRKIYVIGFINKFGTFPKKTKLNGAGEIYMSDEGMPLKVVLRNVEDRFSTYVHDTGKPRVLVTPYTLEVNYDKIGDKIYTQSVSQKLSWIKPDNTSDSSSCYCLEPNSYAKPFANKLRTETYVYFENPVLANAGKRRFTMADDVNYYVDEKAVNSAFWEDELRKLQDYKDIYRDLGASKVPFSVQTVERSNDYIKLLKSTPASDLSGNPHFDLQQIIDRYKSAYIYGRELYKYFYKKDYMSGNF